MAAYETSAPVVINRNQLFAWVLGIVGSWQRGQTMQSWLRQTLATARKVIPAALHFNARMSNHLMRLFTNQRSTPGAEFETLGGSRRFSCIYRDHCAPRSEAQANVRSELKQDGRGLRVIVQSLMTR